MFDKTKVYKASERVCKAWAKQSEKQESLNSIQHEGKSLYSYGYHYLLGRLMQYRGKPIAMVNVTDWIQYSEHSGRRLKSQTTAMQQDYAVSAAQKAGHLVVRVNTREGEGLRAYTTDQELEQAIAVSLYEEHNAYLERLASLSYSAYGTWETLSLKKNIKKFNTLVAELGHGELVISVPAEFYAYVTKIGKANIEAKRDHEKRNQHVFEFSRHVEFENGKKYKVETALTKRPSYSLERKLQSQTA